jgi:sigma-70-like protein
VGRQVCTGAVPPGEGRSCVEPRANPPAWEVGWYELQAVLDEEVARLAPADRAAFVLCCLEGLSKSEAAEQLGIKANTVSSQLARARKRLQVRLARRGISLSAVLAALAGSDAGQAVPPHLVRTATTAASRLGAGTPVTGLSARVLSLAEGVTTMLTSNTKRVAGLLVALCVLGTGLGLLARSAPPPDTQTKSQPPTAKDEAKSTVYSGRVLDPKEKPVAGAKLYLTLSWGYLQRPSPLPTCATTGPDGRFTFTVPKAQFAERTTTVAVMAADHAVTWVDVLPSGKQEGLTIRLAKEDVPITGQVVDLQGKPVQGATLQMLYIGAVARDDLGPWLEAVKGKDVQGSRLEFDHFRQRLLAKEVPALSRKVTTDAKGRFRLRGIGRNRLVVLRLDGPGIASQQLRILTRPGETITVQDVNALFGNPRVDIDYHAASFKHVAAATKPIIGVVRDRDTNKPLAGVTIKSYKLANNPIHGIDFLQTTTDAQGCYRLSGMPKGKDNKIVLVPRDDQPYLSVHAAVPDSPGFDPVTVDFTIKRGVWIEGKITDKAGKPQQGQVQYFALYPNPNLRDYPSLDGTLTRSVAARPDGSYRVVGLPGPGVIAVTGYSPYLRCTERADAEGSKESVLYAAPFHILALNYHALARLDPARGVEQVKRDVTRDPGWTFTGTIRGPDDKPLAGARGLGLTDYSWEGAGMKTAEFTVRAFNPQRPRPVLFIHPEKGLVGVARPPKENGGSVTVRLEPGAAIVGRLVDADGQPRPGIALSVTFRPKGSPVSLSASATPLKTDQQGRFRVGAVLLDHEFRLSDGNGELRSGGPLRTGQTNDLGDLRLK